MRSLVQRLKDAPAMALYRRTGFIFAVESVGKLAIFATTFVAASILPAAQFAQFGVLLAVQQFVALLAQGGLAEAAIGEIGGESQPPRRQATYQAAFAALAWSALVVGVVVVGWTLLLSPMTGARGAASSFSLFAGGLASAAVMLRANFLVLEGNTLGSCGLKALFYLGSAGGGLAVLLFTRSAEGYFWGNCILGVPCGYLAWCQSPLAGADRVARDVVMKLFRRALPFAGTALLGWATWGGATLLIYACFDARVTACYTLMASLCSILVFITGAVNQAWQPDMLRSMRGTPQDLERSRGRLAGLLELTLLGGAIGLLAMVVVAAERSIWFPARYPEMEFLLPVSFAFVLANLNYYSAVNQFVFFSAGRKFLQISVLTYLAGAVAWVVLGHRYGELGVYAGWGLTHFIRGIAVSRHAAAQWAARTQWYRTLRVLALLVLFSYLLSLDSTVQAWRFLLR